MEHIENNVACDWTCIVLVIPGNKLGCRHSARSGGIWKAAVPPSPMTGEFDSFDPIGVAAGARIKADCSLNWINPDDGKLYCFSSGTSLEVFPG